MNTKSIARALAGVALCVPCACRSAEHDEGGYEGATYEASPSERPAVTESVTDEALAGAGVAGDTGIQRPATAEASWRVSDDDWTFVSRAADGGLFEIRSSELALLRDVSEETRDFAQLMIDDHGRAYAELRDLAEQKGLQVPATPGEATRTELDALERLEGEDFEYAYRQAQVRAHDAAIALFERAVDTTDDADLRAFAERLLPTLREHRSLLGRLSMDRGAGR